VGLVPMFREPVGRRLRSTVAEMRAFVRAVLARGWFARLAACVVVAVAAVVWLGALLVLLRVLVVVVLLVAMFCCVWLVAAVWVRRPLGWEGPRGSLPRLLWARAAVVFAQRLAGRGNTNERNAEVERFDQELEKHEVALAALRCSLDTLSADLFDRQERVNADAERLQQELTLQIETMGALVERVTRFEQADASFRANPEKPAPESDRRLAVEDVASGLAPDRGRSAEPDSVTDTAMADLDFDTAWHELKTDLRLEKIEEREQMLGELEERLNRRERELAAFVAQTQAQLG
jgi:hypothetical protein